MLSRLHPSLAVPKKKRLLKVWTHSPSLSVPPSPSKNTDEPALLFFMPRKHRL